MKKRGYTLIEILVVLGIIGLMAALGVPSYKRYGNSIDFREKNDEIKELIEQTHLLALNPENNKVVLYELMVDRINNQKLILRGCENINLSTGGCLVTDFEGTKVVRTVELSANQVWQSAEGLGNYDAVYMRCLTNLSTKCQYGQNLSDDPDLAAFRFFDYNLDPNKKADFLIKNIPFTITLKTESL